MNRIFWTATFALSALFSSAAQAQQSFSCPLGRSPSCLDIGDRVVDSGAQCFDQFQCFPDGFVCKSTLDKVSAEHQNTIEMGRTLAEAYDNTRRCVSRAGDLDEAQNCLRRYQWTP